MQAIAIFNALLSAASGVTALVGARIYPLELPQGCTLPASAIDAGRDDPIPTIDANAPYGMRSCPVTVHLVAKTLAELSALSTAVEAACNFQRGLFAGQQVVSVGQGTVESPETDSSTGTWYVPVTFPLTYRR